MSLIKKNEAQKRILQKQLLEGRKFTNALDSPTQYNKVQELETNLNILKKSLENIRKTIENVSRAFKCTISQLLKPISRWQQ